MEVVIESELGFAQPATDAIATGDSGDQAEDATLHKAKVQTNGKGFQGRVAWTLETTKVRSSNGIAKTMELPKRLRQSFVAAASVGR